MTLADEETDEEQTFQIVGEDEADIKQRPAVGDLAAGARPDRQGQGRQRRGIDPRGAKSYEVVTVAFG